MMSVDDDLFWGWLNLMMKM